MRYEKRIFDLFFASALLLAALPLFLVIAALIYSTKTGPIFFRRRRYGLNGATFEILKFRTLSSSKGKPVAMADFLRRTCLDELPQLINVLKGEMSLVGPRPLDVEESDALALIYPRHHRRHTVPPGLTGSGQIEGMRGLLDRTQIERRLRLDIAYTERNSFRGDLMILWLTPFSILCGPKAAPKQTPLKTPHSPGSADQAALALATFDRPIPNPSCLTSAEIGA